jgi:hypothetical protein
MSKKEIISVALKIFGIYLLIQCTFLAQYVLKFFVSDRPSEDSLWLRFIPLLSLLISLMVYFFLGIYMIEKSDKLSQYVIKEEENTTFNLNVDRNIIFEIVFIVCGLFTIIDIAPHVLSNLYHWIKLEVTEENDYTFLLENNNLLYSVIKTTIGLLLIFNAKRLAIWVVKRNKEVEDINA